MEAYYNCLLGYDSINLGDADYPEFSQGIPVEYKTKIEGLNKQIELFQGETKKWILTN